jgi:hypothetical protein
MNGKSQTGLVCGSSVDDYENDLIKKHEFTRPEKELDRINHIKTTGAQTGNVFLAYRNVDEVDAVIEKWTSEKNPQYDFVADDDIQHSIWIVNDDNTIEKITELFKTKVPCTYIADGHHRAASAAKVSQAANPVAPQSNTRKSDEYAKPVIPAPVQTQQTTTAAQPKPVQPATKQTAAVVNQTANVGANAGIGYFASLFTSQSKEGKQQKMETPAYGVFKSTSGWQDGKYYVLMNSVVPGTVVQITAKNTGKQLYAKVLGAVPPGKESEGLLLRISNAAASALGVPNGEPGVFELVWSN